MEEKSSGTAARLQEFVEHPGRLGPDAGRLAGGCPGAERELQVLRHHRGREPGLVVAVRGRGGNRTGNRAVAGQRPALPGRLRDDREQRLGTHPELLAHGQALAGRDHRNAEYHVVADLGDLTGARHRRHGPPCRPMTSSSGAMRRNPSARPSHHEGQGSGFRPAGPAGYRCVEHHETRRGRGAGHVPGRVHIDRRTVDQYGPLRRPGQDGAGVDVADVPAPRAAWSPRTRRLRGTLLPTRRIARPPPRTPPSPPARCRSRPPRAMRQ